MHRERCWHGLVRFCVLVALVWAGVGNAGCGDDSHCEPCNDNQNQNCNEVQVPLGNIGLRDGHTAETAQAGMPSEMRVTVYAETTKLNAYIRLSLIPENGSMEDRIPVGGALVDKLDPGEEQEVVQTYVLPADLPPGTYTGVFTVNEEDFFPDDDQLQGEAPEDQGDNTVVADASMLVTVPDGPVIEVTTTSLNENAFTISRYASLSDRDATSLMEDPDLLLQQELVARVASIPDPVEVSFSLQVGSDATGLVPLKVLEVADTGNGTELSLADRAVIEPTCLNGDGALVDPGTTDATCAALHRNSPVGRTYNLFVPDEAYAQIPAEETSCILVVTVDPDNKLNLASGSRDALTIELPVEFLPEETDAEPWALGPKKVVYVNKSRTWGKTKFNAGYRFSTTMNYWTSNWDLGGVHFPVRGAFNASGALPVTVFGHMFNVIDAGIGGDLDIDNIVGSYFEYWFDLFGRKIFGQKTYLHGTGGVVNEILLMDSHDSHGDERFARSVSKDVSTTFWAGPIPITVKGGFTGTLGITGYAAIKPHNILEVGVGPFVELNGWAEVGVGVPGLNATIGGSLLIIRLTQLVRPYLQLEPSFPRAEVGIGFPLLIDTLSGRIYLAYRFLFWHGEISLISWNGLHYEINYVTPFRWTWGFGDAQSQGMIRALPVAGDSRSTSCYRASDLDPNDPAFYFSHDCTDQDHVAFVYMGQKFALYDPDNNRYLTYVSSTSTLEFQAASGQPTPTQLFTAQQTDYWDPDRNRWMHAYWVKTIDGKYWGCPYDSGVCEVMELVSSKPRTPCRGERCQRGLFVIEWGERADMMN